MGQIIAPHGIKGWVKVKIFTERPDSLLNYPKWWLLSKTGWQAYEVAEAEWRESGLVARLQGFNDRTKVEAEALQSQLVGVPRAEFPELEQHGEHYWSDLIGLEVINKQNEQLGTIQGFIETGANDVLVVREDTSDLAPPIDDAPPKKIERLIPYIESVIVSVDIANRCIIVDWSLDY